MLIVTQVIPVVGVMLIMLGQAIFRSGTLDAGLEWLNSQLTEPTYLMPALAASQVMLFLLSLIVLRFAVGADWTRQVALRRPAFVHVVLAVVAVPGMALAADGCYLAAKNWLPGLSALLSYFATTVIAVALLSVGWGLLRLATGKNLLRELARLSPGEQLGLVIPAVVGVISAAGWWMMALMAVLPSIELFDKKSIMEDVVGKIRDWPAALAVLIVGLGPGLGEELWCRAFLGRGLVGRYGVVLGVLLTSLFFGFIHLDPHQGTMAVFMGLALYYAYLMTRSLWVPMLLHFLNNSLSVIADKVPDPLRSQLTAVDTHPEAIPGYLYVAAALLVAAVGWALYSSRARLVRCDGTDQPPWQPPFPGVAHPPENSGTAVSCPWPGWLPSLAVLLGFILIVLVLVLPDLFSFLGLGR
jgi:membrane protease YdiL (CAAX protease family)